MSASDINVCYSQHSPAIKNQHINVCGLSGSLSFIPAESQIFCLFLLTEACPRLPWRQEHQRKSAGSSKSTNLSSRLQKLKEIESWSSSKYFSRGDYLISNFGLSKIHPNGFLCSFRQLKVSGKLWVRPCNDKHVVFQKFSCISTWQNFNRCPIVQEDQISSWTTKINFGVCSSGRGLFRLHCS